MRPWLPYVVAGVAASAVGALIAFGSFSRSDATVANDAAPTDASEFCASGLETLSADACFSPRDASRGLVVYLHGRYSAETAPEELDRQARVARLAGARGYAMLALRGVRGECSAPEYKDFSVGRATRATRATRRRFSRVCRR